MSILAYFIWPAYLVAALVVFVFSAQPERVPSKRAEAYALGLALMCMGAGRLLLTFDPNGLEGMQWMFELAHCAMLTFVALKISNYSKERKLQ